MFLRNSRYIFFFNCTPGRVLMWGYESYSDWQQKTNELLAKGFCFSYGEKICEAKLVCASREKSLGHSLPTSATPMEYMILNTKLTFFIPMIIKISSVKINGNFRVSIHDFFSLPWKYHKICPWKHEMCTWKYLLNHIRENGNMCAWKI